MKFSSLTLVFLMAFLVTACSVPESTNELSQQDVDTSEEQIASEQNDDEGGGMLTQNEIDVPEGFSPIYGSYNQAFYVPNTYWVDGEFGSAGTDYLEQYMIFNNKYADWDEIEGHPAISVYVFDNPYGKSLKTLAVQYKNYTNFSEDVNVTEGVTQNGYEYLMYSVTGLFDFDYYLLENGDQMHVFTGFDSSDSMSEREAVKEVVETLVFQ